MAGTVMVTRGGGGGNMRSSKAARIDEEEQKQLSLVDFLLAALKKSMSSCRVDKQEDIISTVHQIEMEIGWPTNVQHITHVTFDRFQGFLGLPVEFEVEVPCRSPSASISVFGVSAESMQCSFDKRGNSVPTILLLMQERLYVQGGLKAEGIFRINPENSKEEYVRDQLNRGIVPDDIEVHCLAGLIKAWFRELPSGVLDGLSPEQVLQCNEEEEFVDLVEQLKPTESALLNWAIDLMADIVEHEESNKMNARNIAMVFAPNMTQMSDPLTALMHAVQVMNLLKSLIVRTLRKREDTIEVEDTHHEMDMIYESAGPVSDDESPTHYSNSSDEKGDLESISDIEECFMRQLDENENAKNDFRKKLESILCKDVSPQNGSASIGGSYMTLYNNNLDALNMHGRRRVA